MTVNLEAVIHPMLTSVVHQPFKSAIREIGCSELPIATFNSEITPHLNVLRGVLEVNELTSQRLFHAVNAAEVLAAEMTQDNLMVFHVRAPIHTQFIDIRLTYHLDKWKIAAITSIHRRPFRRTSLFSIMVLCGAVLAAGLIGFGVAKTHQHLTQNAVESWAAVNGYELVKPGLHPISANTSANPPGDSGHSVPTQSTPAPAPYTFTFRNGMTVHDISMFLAKNHLVSNDYAFDKVLKASGTDKVVRPGAYTFHSGMSQAEIIQVLRGK